MRLLSSATFIGGIERYIEKEESPEARQLIARVQETTVTGMNSRLIARESRLYRSMVLIKALLLSVQESRVGGAIYFIGSIRVGKDSFV
jgi:hypothetical protein